MKDRFMGENTHLLYDLMHYLEENNKTGLVLLVDFEKAFDSIEWLFLKKVLNSFILDPPYVNGLKHYTLVHPAVLLIMDTCPTFLI